MSPRPDEYLEQARDRLAAAQEIIKSGHPAAAASAAYYSMHNAASAALVKDDEHPWGDDCTWDLFHQRFVTSGAFSEDLHSLAKRAQEARERGDYEAVTPPQEEAKSYVDGAADFLTAIDAMRPG